MKNILLAFMALPLLIACSPSKENIVDFSQLTISMDTVMVDSKDEILYLRSGLNVSDLSEDGKFLYNMNPMDLQLEIIDLDKLEFTQKIGYETEGPDGLGRYPRDIQILGPDQIFLGSFSGKGVFDLQGKKIKALNVKMEELGGDSIPPKFGLRSNLLFPSNPNKMLVVLDAWDEGFVKLGIVNHEENIYYNLSIPDYDYLNDFKMIWYNDGNPMSILGNWMVMSISEGNVILSNNIGADLYIFDLASEKLEHKAFEHQAFSSRKSIKLPPRVETQEAFQENNRKFGEDINFTPPVWDQINQVYYRFAFNDFWKEVDGEMIFSEAEVFLVVMDKDFFVLAESKVDGYKKRPGHYFAKDGKIWIFENMDDEMGFIRLSLEFMP